MKFVDDQFFFLCIKTSGAMCEKNLTNKSTPLRNSNSANKPFRSPLSTVTTPTNLKSPKNHTWQSPIRKTATPKRSISQFRLPIKRRRIENVPNDDSVNDNTNDNVTRSDFLAIKRRLCKKRQEIENLKTKSIYIKKHKREDLFVQIDKWRTACKEALYKFHKQVKDKSSEIVPMRQVLSMLSIPEDIVKFTPEECDMT